MKLPYNLQEKWTNTAVKYTNEHNAVYPPFHVFVRFVQEQSRIKNNPSFMYNSSLTSTNKITSPRNTTSNKAERVLTRKTSVSETLSSDIENLCPIHRSNHSLEHCRAFRAKPLDQRRKILKDNNMCFKCLSKTHKQHECTSDVKCAECGSSYHSTPLHVKRKPVFVNSVISMRPDGGEDTGYRNRENVNSKCTQICGDPFNFKGKSCAKTVLVDVFKKLSSETKKSVCSD